MVKALNLHSYSYSQTIFNNIFLFSLYSPLRAASAPRRCISAGSAAWAAAQSAARRHGPRPAHGTEPRRGDTAAGIGPRCTGLARFGGAEDVGEILKWKYLMYTFI